MEEKKSDNISKEEFLKAIAAIFPKPIKEVSNG